MLLQAQHAQILLLDWQSQLLAALPQAAVLQQRAAVLKELAEVFAVPLCSSAIDAPWAGDYAAALQAEGQQHVLRQHYSAAGVAGASLLPLLERQAQPAPKGNARSLPKHLQKAAAEPRSDLLLAGCYSHSSIMQTALDLLATEDWNVIVLSDCCASPQTRDHEAALDRLAAQGAELLSLEMLALEWLADSQSRRAPAVYAALERLA